MIPEKHPPEPCFHYDQIGGIETVDEVEDPNDPYIGILMHCHDKSVRAPLYFKRHDAECEVLGTYLITDIIKDWCRQNFKENQWVKND